MQFRHLVLFVMVIPAWSSARADLQQSLVFHASFDEHPDADFAKGDGRVFTADSLKRIKVEPGILTPKVVLSAKKGRYGGAIEFKENTEQVILFRAKDNVPYAENGFDVTVSFWMAVDPENGLKPGYVDPIQITDKKWNDSAIWVDFTKDDSPRQFRLGVLSQLAHWNKENEEWDSIPVSKRPLVGVAKPKFRDDRWTHVGITIRDINRKKTGAAILYLDGESQGTLERDFKMVWDQEKNCIMLGIAYIGMLDDFAIFDRSLSAGQIKSIMSLKSGIRELHESNTDD